MKKIINNLFWLLALFLIACGGNSKPEEPINPQTIIDSATEVIGIGKVLPKGGIIELSALSSGIVEQIAITEGDTILNGALMVQLKAEEQQLATAESYAQLATQQAKTETSKLDLKSAGIKLDELHGIYQTSKKLNAAGAETQEVVNADYTAFRQQEQEVAKAEQQLRIDNRLEIELNEKIKMAQLSVTDREIRAPRDGIVLSMDLKQGQVVQPNQVFGEFAALGEKIIECEVDELYADRIKEGNAVSIYPVGSNKSIASGTVVTIGVALQNKSILYESVGEGADRRVRKLIITISKKDKELLINDKVECRISL